MSEIAEIRVGGGKNRMGEGSHGHPRYKAADVTAKSPAEKVRSLEYHEKWMSGGGTRQWMRQRKRKYLEERRGDSGYWQSYEVEAESSNKLLLQTAVEREDKTDGGCGMLLNGGRDTGSYCVWCRNIRRVKDERWCTPKPRKSQLYGVDITRGSRVSAG